MPTLSRATRLLIAVLSLLALLSACSDTPQPTEALRPTATVRPIIKPTDTATVAPIKPTLPNASSTPTQPPASTPDTRLMTTFAADVDPLTGEKVSDPNVLNRRPLAIKIGDLLNYDIRPQAGASLADWVFEHETEANGAPRWTAIFYSQTPQRVGGTRSCRIIDAELPAIFKALMACSGMSGGTREYYIKPADFTQEGRMFTPDFGDWTPMFYRTDNAVPPLNMFVNPIEIWKEADKRGVNTKPDLSGLAFSTGPLAPGQSASEIKVKFGSETDVWKYDPKTTSCGSVTGCYLRWSAGVPHTDALNGQQLSAATVIVIFVNHVEDVRFLEEEYGNLKLFGIQIQLWNSAPVKIFRDGQEFDGTWSRTERNQMLRFIDASGNLMPLKPGKTWVELQRLEAQVDVTP